MSAVPSWLSLVVADLKHSSEWYASALGCEVDDRGPTWACLRFPNRTIVELTAGDPARPSLSNTSYSRDSASPLIPGYAVDDPLLAAAGLRIVRRFPDWILVAAPGGLHTVLHQHEVGPGRGLVGFRYTCPDAGAQRAFLAGLGRDDPVLSGPTPAVVPIILSNRGGTEKDPDGNDLQLITRRAPAP
ncbi:MAG: hypothetical protein ACRD0K_26605 [Egibacteraceae bacterium]